MKLDLGDGRILQLPDEMSDESARQLKCLILVCEERATAAEACAQNLERRILVLEGQKPDYTPITVAIGRMHESVVIAHESMTKQMQRLERAALADRQMVLDEYGEYTISRTR